MSEKETNSHPEFVSRQAVPKHFSGASPKTLANLNSKGLSATKPLSFDIRIDPILLPDQSSVLPTALH